MRCGVVQRLADRADAFRVRHHHIGEGAAGVDRNPVIAYASFPDLICGLQV